MKMSKNETKSWRVTASVMFCNIEGKTREEAIEAAKDVIRQYKLETDEYNYCAVSFQQLNPETGETENV